MSDNNFYLATKRMNQDSQRRNSPYRTFEDLYIWSGLKDEMSYESWFQVRVLDAFGVVLEKMVGPDVRDYVNHVAMPRNDNRSRTMTTFEGYIETKHLVLNMDYNRSKNPVRVSIKTNTHLDGVSELIREAEMIQKIIEAFGSWKWPYEYCRVWFDHL